MEKPGAHASERLASTSSDAGAPAGKPSFGTRLKRFLRRWWWLVLLIFAIVVLVIILPLVFVGFPRAAQREVNESDLEIRSIRMTNPTPDSFHLEQEHALHSYSSRHPHLDAFTATVSLGSISRYNKPLFTVDVPAIHATDVALFSIVQDVKILDEVEFMKYALGVLGESYRLGITGKTGLKQSGLRKITVDYNEEVELKGLNRLKGLNVTEFEVKAQPEPDGSNMLGKVFIPNPSIMTLAMGNVTLNLSVQDTPIGTAVLPNLVLRPGDNIVDMRATTNRLAVLQKLAAFPSGILPVDIVGNSSVFEGQHLRYFEGPLSGTKITLDLNVGAALNGSAAARGRA